jgi:23S rRNA (adenine2503-C2)-methyltransferase
MGLARNLGAGEMVAQVVGAAREARRHGRYLTNIVMMGMGEPLQNYAETIKFINIVHDPNGLDIGARRITVSTSGIVPKIDALAAEPLQLNLAVSLHAPHDELRSRLVPHRDAHGSGRSLHRKDAAASFLRIRAHARYQ